jgi:hypothetical protein
MSANKSKTQDIKFVEWSRGVNEESYDLSEMMQIIESRFKGKSIKIADIGGGIGTTANALCSSFKTAYADVIDNSPLAKESFIGHSRSNLIFEDFFEFKAEKKYDVVIFRTVLHHFVGQSEKETLALQTKALDKTYSQLIAEGGLVFIIENFYEPAIGNDITGRIIYELTKLEFSSAVFRYLGANTAGEGVRFRSFMRWKSIFEKCGFELGAKITTEDWSMPMPIWQRIPFVCKNRYQALVVLRHSVAADCPGEEIKKQPQRLEQERDVEAYAA